MSGILAGRGSPLLLAAAEPLASIFRTVNTYPRLVDDMIAGNPDHVSDAQLADAALPILDRLDRRELEAAIALFNELKPRRATTDVSYAAHAATAGAIDQLLVDLDAVIPGLVSDIDGSVTYSTSDATPVEDFRTAIMAVGAQQYLGVGPVGPDRPQQAAQECESPCHPAVWRGEPAGESN